MRHVSLFKSFRTAMIMAPVFAAILGAPSAANAQQSEPLTIEASELLEWDQNAGIYIAKGGAIAKQGRTELAAEELVATYDPKAAKRRIDKVVATGNVDYKSADTLAQGEKLTYDIKGLIYVVEGKNAVVSGATGTMTATRDINYNAADPANKTIVARGSAVYVDADKRTISGERVVGIIGADGALKTINADDNVKVVTSDGKIATGDSVTYDYATSKAVLTGNVEVKDGPNVMRGARAEVDFDTGISRILSDGSGSRVSGVLSQ